MLPYIPNDIFEYDELHEGGEKLLKFLDEHNSSSRDLALGLITHGYKYGADKFKEKSEEFVRAIPNLLEMITKANFISPKFAHYRVHNYSNLGLDWLLAKKEPSFVKTVQQTLEKINTKEIAKL